MIRTIPHKVFLRLSAAFSVVVLAAGCLSGSKTGNDPEEGPSVLLSAEVARQIYTRSDPDGVVREGEFYLTYPPVSGTPLLATVHFGMNNELPEMGIVTDGNGKELKWIHVFRPNPTFYLDNVPPALSDGSSADSVTEIRLDPDKNPFKAGLFDEKSNDLLWSSVTATHGAKTVHFDLHHNMARVRVEVTVDRTNEKEQGDLDLDGAKVYITSLIHDPVSYNRLDGSLALGDDPEYKDLVLVDERDGNNDKMSWRTREAIDEVKDIYATQDFVLPPQGLLEDAQRPKLVIELKSGATYSGILPHAMLVMDENADPTDPTTPTYPVALHFLKEHILTIRTTITEDPPELIFMPVTVVQWVDKGNFTIEAHEAGIYTATEFSRLIGYYANNNEYQLVRYGKQVQEEGSTDKKWAFVFFHSVTLDYDTIAGSMSDRTNGQDDFYFVFNNYAVYVRKNGEEPVSVTREKLYDIVVNSAEL